jgi:hypothetical protein
MKHGGRAYAHGGRVKHHGKHHHKDGGKADHQHEPHDEGHNTQREGARVSESKVEWKDKAGEESEGKAKFRHGGHVREDESEDRVMIRKAVHKHESHMHKGEKETKLKHGVHARHHKPFGGPVVAPAGLNRAGVRPMPVPVRGPIGRRGIAPAPAGAAGIMKHGGKADHDADDKHEHHGHHRKHHDDGGPVIHKGGAKGGRHRLAMFHKMKHDGK